MLVEFFKSVVGGETPSRVSESSPLPVAAQTRTCLGGQMFTGLSSVTADLLTVPSGAVVADIQADGGPIRIRRDGSTTAPTTTLGWRIDDGASITVDSILVNVRLIAASGAPTNVQVAYFDKV